MHAGRWQGGRSARRGGGVVFPAFAAEQESPYAEDQQGRQGAAPDEQRSFVEHRREWQTGGGCPRFARSSRIGGPRGFEQKCGFKGQGFDHQLVAALRREAGNAGHQVANHFQFFRSRRYQDPFERVFVLFPGDLLVHQYSQRHFAEYARGQVGFFDGAAGLIGDVFRGAGGFVGAAVGAGGGPRQGGSRARDAVGSHPPRDVFGTLRSEHDTACGIEDFLAQFSAREIALHGYAGAEFFGPEERAEGGADLGDKGGFDLVPVVQRRAGRRRAVQIGRGLRAAEQIAVHVQQGNRVGRKAFDRTGNQVVDGGHVLRGEVGTRPDPDQHAGFGGLLGLEKHGVLGEGQVDPSLLDLDRKSV